jgi:ATP/maltotriose-dependent transcriptional regulator MalT
MDLTAGIGLRLSAAEAADAPARIDAELARRPTADLRLAAGVLSYVAADFPRADRLLIEAFKTYKDDGRPRRAALAAGYLARLHYDGIGNEAVGNGWFARARRLLDAEGDCVELGWVLLARVGCSFASADELSANAVVALEIARRTGDDDLECKALADYGLALVRHGEVARGMQLLDEAMAMASGECDNVIVCGQVRCCLVTACERTGDLARLESWLSAVAAAEPATFGPAAAPNVLLGHCQSEFGSMLCSAGRWGEAEVALQRAVAVTDAMHFRQRAQSRAALAGLRIDQGRLPEAAALLNGLEQRAEAQLPLLRLHVARGDHELAVAVGRYALRMFAGDRLREVPLQQALVDAELGRGNLDAAREAAAAVAAIAVEVAHPHILATAELAAGRVAAAEGDDARAAARFEGGLATIGPGQWPLLGADLELGLAAVLARRGAPARPLAIAGARRALVTLRAVGAARMHDAQRLLHQLGDAAAEEPAVPDAVRKLTAREQEILGLLARGWSNRQIAEQLVIAPKTAEHHVAAILRKLQLGNRSEAAVYAATLAAIGR